MCCVIIFLGKKGKKMKILRNFLSSALLGMLLMGASVEAHYGKKDHGSDEKNEHKGHEDRSDREEGGDRGKRGKHRKHRGGHCERHGYSKKDHSGREERSERKGCGKHKKECGKKHRDS